MADGDCGPFEVPGLDGLARVLGLGGAGRGSPRRPAAALPGYRSASPGTSSTSLCPGRRGFRPGSGRAPEPRGPAVRATGRRSSRLPGRDPPCRAAVSRPGPSPPPRTLGGGGAATPASHRRRSVRLLRSTPARPGPRRPVLRQAALAEQAPPHLARPGSRTLVPASCFGPEPRPPTPTLVGDDTGGPSRPHAREPDGGSPGPAARVHRPSRAPPRGAVATTRSGATPPGLRSLSGPAGWQSPHPCRISCPYQ
jgi:hypothetical protein